MEEDRLKIKSVLDNAIKEALLCHYSTLNKERKRKSNIERYKEMQHSLNQEKVRLCERLMQI